MAALLVACVGWWADWEIGQVMREELTDDLRTTLSADVTALEIWMANQKRIAAVLAEEPRLKNLAVELLNKGGARTTDPQAMANLARQLIVGDRLQARLNSLGYAVAQLVSTNCEVVLDSGRVRSRMGTQVAEDLQPKYTELFASGEPIIITPFKMLVPERPDRPPSGRRQGRPRGPGPPGSGPPFGGRPSTNTPTAPRSLTIMQVAAPVKDTNGVTCGALALIINPDAEFTRILSVARSGESGETFAFDPEGVMLSKSRFEGQLQSSGLLASGPGASSALTLHLTDPGGDLTHGFKPPGTNTYRPLIKMVQRAIDGSTGVEVEPFRDYRGVPVIGAWVWLPHYGFGVGTKMDAREAYRTLRLVRMVFVVLFLLLVLASLVILLYSYRQVMWRRRLTEAELKARQLGQYQLVEKIGEGGMGVVYKAHHALLRRETALKLLTPDKADPISIQRFEREVRLTCRLMHPNTIQVFDYGHTPEGIFYYAMEYLDGLNLAEFVEAYGPQPEGRVVNLLIQVCESLAEAHASGLIHRDIKPANIFVTDRGGVPDMVKVLDFGLVRPVVSADGAALDAADTEIMAGTPSYMSPEAAENGANADARSDLYSVGSVGYYLLTGQSVFDGETIAEICKKRMEEKPVPPTARIGRPICPHLEAVILRCLERDPKDRPQSAHELIRLLAASPRIADWNVEKRGAWWVAHREAINRARAAEAEPIEKDKAVNIEIEDRTP
ncbi:MAG: serine/threonine protein kinase [Verrucomicrobia bacterium]|nr:serine/threonine protein kinase [Verrucomicrobiota bacterium]